MGGPPSQNPLDADHDASCDRPELPNFPQPLDDKAGARQLEVYGRTGEKSHRFHGVPLGSGARAGSRPEGASLFR